MRRGKGKKGREDNCRGEKVRRKNLVSERGSGDVGVVWRCWGVDSRVWVKRKAMGGGEGMPGRGGGV